jgi:uncharacterized protein (DUF2141 family)
MRKVVRCILGMLAVLSLATGCDSDPGTGTPPPPPPPEPNTISGTVSGPPSMSLAGTEVALCFISGGQCEPTSPNNKTLTLQEQGSSATYAFTDVPDGQYVLVAVKDSNANGTLDAGDYLGVHGSAQVAIPVRPPSKLAHITLARYTPPAASHIRGTVTAPRGGDVRDTLVVACFISAGQCDVNNAKTQVVSISGTGASGTYDFPRMAAGQYGLVAIKDVNGNNQFDNGDYEGVYTAGGLHASLVTPPAQGIDITLKVRGGEAPSSYPPLTPPPGVTFLRPSDFSSGTATVTFQGLAASERIAVIPVHASQALSVDGLSFNISTTGVAAQGLPLSSLAALPRADVAGPGDEALREEVLRHERHLDLLQKGLEDVEQLQRAGLRPLSARGTHRAQALDNCAGPYTVDAKTCPFWIARADGSQTRITATLKQVSANAYWFVQNEDLSEFSAAELQRLASDFESKVLPTDIQYFGNLTDADLNQKVIIVFSRLLGPQGMLGYVLPLDIFDDSEVYPQVGLHSNEGDIFYAATPSSLAGLSRERYFSVVMPSTMVHELKHLIASGRRITAGSAPEELWIEEGSAMAAQQLAGLGTQVAEVQAYARHALASPHGFRVVHARRPTNSQEGLSLYGYNFLLVWRAAQHKGHAQFWKAWTAGPGRGIANLEAHTGMAFSDLMMDWASALALDHTSLLPSYDYDSFNLRDGSWQLLGSAGLQSGVSGTARSMAYFVGRGTGSDASITLRVTNVAAPHAVLLRLPGALPWEAGGAPQPIHSGGLSGLVLQGIPPAWLAPAHPVDPRTVAPRLLGHAPRAP